MPTSLLIASENSGKLREFRQVMSGLPLDIVSPADVGLRLSVAETGATFWENAALKARAYAEASGMPALADDSGLEVDALGGRPGVHSARYAGLRASDAQRRQKLLSEMASVPASARGARFVCVLVLCWNGQLYTTQGLVEGQIAFEERGSFGFGYDSIFLLPERGQTMAELLPEEKNAISHRGSAARAMRELLASLLGPTGTLS